MPVRTRDLVRLCAAALGVCGLILLLMGWARGSPPAKNDPPLHERGLGGALRIVSEAPRSLDPLDASSVYESIPLNQIFNGLVAVDQGLHVLPSLASTWTISRDGRVYMLRIRPGVRFQDGSPLTADDVVFTFQRLLSPRRSRRNVACSYLQIVEGAEAYMNGTRSDLPGIAAVGPLMVRISLTRPYMSFLEVLAMDGLKVVPRAVVEREGDEAFGRAPVGTGAFRLESWNSEAIALAANPDHFGGRPLLDRVDIAFFRPGETDYGAARFERGEIDVLEVPAERLEDLSVDPNVSIDRYQDLTLAFLGISSKRAPLDDVRVRQALAFAIDRDRIVADSSLYRRSATGILPPGMQTYSPEPKTLRYDPEKSRALLAQAGHPRGRALPVLPIYCAADRPSTLRIAELIRADLLAVGVRTELRQVPWPELSRAVESQDAPLFLLNWLADLSDPDSFLRSLFESGGSSNYFDYRDPLTEGLLAEGARETDPMARIRAYRRVEQRILDLAPLVPLYHPINHLAKRAGLRRFGPGPLGISNIDFGKVHFAEQRSM